MKIMVIGNGAREHALIWKIAQSPKVKEIYVTQGNAGMAALAHNLNVRPTDIEALGKVAREKRVELVIVGPETPLALGIVNHFQDLGIPIFGPTREATQIESSKVFAKRLIQKYGIPSPKGFTFDSYSQAKEYLYRQTLPIVIKAEGLAAGKGVTVAMSLDEGLDALSKIMVERVFGSAGDRVIIEEYLEGKEVSLLVLTDGETVMPLVPACDYKRVFDNDQGPNTGGMGGYSPPGFFNDALQREAVDKILRPAVKAMAKEGIPYKGVLYAGLMVTSEGPKVLEFNARFGDPETQVILPRLNTDLVDILKAVVNNKLGETEIEWSSDACVGVVMASGGYPGSYKTGFPIKGLNELDKKILVFHAGTRLNQNSKEIYTNGGRVLTVAATGKTVAEARAKVYSNLPRIHFEGCHYRKDIATRE